MQLKQFCFPLRSAAFALPLCLSCSIVAHAQIQGELKGRVVDASGAAITGAHVTLTQTATGVRQFTITTSDGIYDFTQLVSGRYSIAVEDRGFAAYQRDGITVATGQTVGLDLPLAVAGSDAVTVTADAALLQSQTSNIETTILGPTIRGAAAEHA